MNKEVLPDSTAYLGEPENYQKTRVEMLSLMNTINKFRQDFDRVTSIALLQEHFKEEAAEVKQNLFQAIYLLGKMHGYTIADDLIENV